MTITNFLNVWLLTQIDLTWDRIAQIAAWKHEGIKKVVLRVIVFDVKTMAIKKGLHNKIFL